MLYEDTNWAMQPKGGWEEFVAAKKRLKDRMARNSEWHQITSQLRADVDFSAGQTVVCQLMDATD